jgi:cytochrome c
MLHRPLALLLLAMATVGTAAAPQGATPDEAEALVQQGVVYLGTQGAERAFAAFSDPHGPFRRSELYLVAYATDGVVLAHGGMARLIGRNLTRLTDPDGRAFVRERVERARTEKAFWHQYRFVNPVSGRVEAKSTYCESTPGAIVCAGVYE